MPVCAYSLRMSMTSGPIVPRYTGSSTLGLPLANDRVALLSAGFMSVPLIKSLPASLAAQQVQQLADLGAVELAGRLASREHQVQEVIVRELHQFLEDHALPGRDRVAMAGKEPLEEQVVLQQPAAATPPQLADRVIV